MITSEQLTVMSGQNIETLKRSELVDISTINIRKDGSPETAVLAFLEQINNPYCFRCGKVPVRICFSKNGTELGAALQNFFIRMKQG